MTATTRKSTKSKINTPVATGEAPVQPPATAPETPKIQKPSSKAKTAKAAGKGVEKAVPASASRAAAPTAKSSPAPKKAKKTTPKASPKTKAAAKKSVAQKPAKSSASEGTAKILDSHVAYEGPLFRVLHDHLIEPDGTESHRDVIRHNGSVVILAVDPGKKKKDPWIVIERQYRHAAGQFLWELPAGKLEAGEQPLDGAKRELAEETGYSAKKWSALVEYYASPGFLGEAMKVFLAEGLIAGDAHPEEDEHIDFRLVKLSELLNMADQGKIIDGKTLTSILLYARIKGIKWKK